MLSNCVAHHSPFKITAMEKDKKKSSKNIDIKRLFKLNLKYWTWYVVGVVACCLLAGAYLMIRKPSYEVDAQLMLPPESSTSGLFGSAYLPDAFSLSGAFGGASTDNEVSVIQSYSVFFNTVRDLGLNTAYFEKEGFLKWMPRYDDSQLNLIVNPSVADTLSVPLRFRLKLLDNGNFDVKLKVKKKTIQVTKNVSLPAEISTPYGTFVIAKTPFFGKSEKPIKNFKINFSSYNVAAQDYMEAVKVFAPNKKTDFVDLTFITTDTKFGKLLLNTIIDNYNLIGNQQKDDMNNRTLAFVNASLAELTEEIDSLARTLESFKKINNITDVSANAHILLQKSSELENALLTEETKYKILKMTESFLQNPENKYSLIPIDNAALQTDGIGAYNKLILDHMRMLSSAKDGNKQVEILEEQIDALRDNILASLSRTIANSQATLNVLKTEANSTSGVIGKIPEYEREYIEIQRTYSYKQQLYLFLERQRAEALMNIAHVNPTMLTVDPPYVLRDEPGLTAKMVLLIAVLLGIIIPFVLIFYIKRNSYPFLKSTDIAEMSIAPILGNVARAEEVLVAPTDSCGESLRMLRANLEFAMQDFGGKALLVTSDVPQEGKTFISSNLAASLAMQGKKVLLVDANLRNPHISEVFGLTGKENGMVHLASSDVEPLSCLSKANLPDGFQLDILTAGTPGDLNPSDILGSPRVIRGLEGLKNDFDAVIIDTPSISAYSDAFVLADVVDMTLFVARVGKTTPNEAEKYNNLCQEGRFKRIALAINCG